jgi:hypothetical protein
MNGKTDVSVQSVFARHRFPNAFGIGYQDTVMRPGLLPTTLRALGFSAGLAGKNAVIATASEARREAIQNASEINGLWIATSLRSSR